MTATLGTARPAMTPAEIDAFLVERLMCHLATTNAGEVTNAPLWFVWHGGLLWLSLNPNRSRWCGLRPDSGPVRGPLSAATVDAGEWPGEIRGVELRGKLRFAEGVVARHGGPRPRPVPPAVEDLFAVRYRRPHDATRYVWAYLSPRKILTWRS